MVYCVCASFVIVASWIPVVSVSPIYPCIYRLFLKSRNFGPSRRAGAHACRAAVEVPAHPQYILARMYQYNRSGGRTADLTEGHLYALLGVESYRREVLPLCHKLSMGKLIRTYDVFDVCERTLIFDDELGDPKGGVRSHLNGTQMPGGEPKDA